MSDEKKRLQKLVKRMSEHMATGLTKEELQDLIDATRIAYDTCVLTKGSTDPVCIALFNALAGLLAELIALCQIELKLPPLKRLVAAME